MYSILLFILIVIVCCNYVVFPLSAGTVDSGKQAISSLSIVPMQSCVYRLCAVIVEPREKNLVKIVNHFMKVLPDYTHFQIFHGTENKDLVYSVYGDDPRVSLWNMGVDNLTIQGYSALLTSTEFWNCIRSENVLIFQTDAITCRKSKHKIEDFYKYDFIGAPVPSYILGLINVLFLGKGYPIFHTRFYNGGLSFRKRSKMLAVIREYPWDEKCTEDMWFCAFLPNVDGKLPSKSAARKFSFEAENLDDTPWGIHKPRKNYEELCRVCSEVEKIDYVPAHTDYRNLYLL